MAQIRVHCADRLKALLEPVPDPRGQGQAETALALAGQKSEIRISFLQAPHDFRSPVGRVVINDEEMEVSGNCEELVDQLGNVGALVISRNNDQSFRGCARGGCYGREGRFGRHEFGCANLRETFIRSSGSPAASSHLISVREEDSAERE